MDYEVEAVIPTGKPKKS